MKLSELLDKFSTVLILELVSNGKVIFEAEEYDWENIPKKLLDRNVFLVDFERVSYSSMPKMVVKLLEVGSD